jgi:hypothetical protein
MIRIKEKIEYVRGLQGNEKCCDCDADGPEWASINLGILLCLNCCGAHRFVEFDRELCLRYSSFSFVLWLCCSISGLGVSLSKVRSLHMDSWDLETLLVMSELGNRMVNEIYEAQMLNGMKKPHAETDA